MIIGLIGFIGSGKGTVADILVEDYGYEKLSFADVLKDATSAIFSWPRELLEGDTKESREFREQPDTWWSEKFGSPVTPRLMLQKVGTEAMRNNIHPDIWLLALERRIKPNTNYVISDVRFFNEADWIKSKFGFNIRVERGPDPEWYETAREQNIYRIKSNDPSIDYMAGKYPDVHASEYSLVGYPNINYKLDNNGTIDELKANIIHMLKVLTGPVIM